VCRSDSEGASVNTPDKVATTLSFGPSVAFRASMIIMNINLNDIHSAEPVFSFWPDGQQQLRVSEEAAREGHAEAVALLVGASADVLPGVRKDAQGKHQSWLTRATSTKYLGGTVSIATSKSHLAALHQTTLGLFDKLHGTSSTFSSSS
jgi:hypothetical protein